MIIQQVMCNGCKKTHERKIYENEFEAVADIFTEAYFVPLWNMMRGKIKEKDIETFCKELVFAAIYHYYRDRRKIALAKNNIERANGIKDSKH